MLPISVAFTPNTAFCKFDQVRISCGKADQSGKKSKQGSKFIRLVSTAGTGYFYTTHKNTKIHKEKLELMKYDPRAKRHVRFIEVK